MPKDFLVENAPSVEGGVVRYEKEGFRFSIDYSSAAARPVGERGYPSFKYDTIDGNRARLWIWSYVDPDDGKFVSGLNVWVENRREYIAGAYVRSDKDTRELADKIFRSACYETR